MQNNKNKNIESIKTMDPTLSRMSWLVKRPNNPDGIDATELMKMTDQEIFVAYEKWSADE